MPNAYMEMFQNWFSGSGSSQRLYTYTDKNGRFKFEYKNQTDSHISLWYGTNSNNTTKILMGLPAKENIELGNIYINNKVTIIIKLKPNASYTSSDTLYYSVGEILGYSKITGPFHEAIVDTVITEKWFTIGENSYNVKVDQTALYWGIGWQDFYHSLVTWNTSNPYHKIPFTARGNCQVDTAYLNIP
jgi:hypothetical protein